MSGTQKTEGVRRIWDKYKFVALVALAGIVLLLWPSGREETAERTSPQAVSAVQAELQQEMEDILGRIQGKGYVSQPLTDFTDASSVPAWSLSYVESLVGQGIISGYNGLLRPNDSVTRAEVCKMLFYLL